MNEHTFKDGDRVSYTRTVQRGNHVSISVHKGTLMSTKGDVAFIRAQNGRLIHTHTSNVRLVGQPNALTEAMQEGAQ